MKDIEQELKSRIESLLEQLGEAKPGSKESVLISTSLTKLIDEYLKVIEGEDKVFTRDAEREKLHAETNKLKKEIERLEKESNSEMDFKSWIMQIRPDQVANLIVILTITGMAVNMEKNGHILPDRILKWGMKLFRA